jgi:hypothetical protein
MGGSKQSGSGFGYCKCGFVGVAGVAGSGRVLKRLGTDCGYCYYCRYL